MGKSQSPGPVYMLPPVIGYNKHDVSRYRNPQYSISPKLYPPGARSQVPGPQYQVRGITEHGKVGVPAYSLASRPKGLSTYISPGPGAYSPEKAPRMKEPRPPAYTMLGRYATGYKNFGPGPAYNLPSMLGPKVPNKPASGAFTIAGRHGDHRTQETPGPANYQSVNANVYKHKPPQFTIAGRVAAPGARHQSPGPAAYVPRKLCGEQGPRFTMGQRLGDNYNAYVTPEDNMPCADH